MQPIYAQKILEYERHFLKVISQGAFSIYVIRNTNICKKNQEIIIGIQTNIVYWQIMILDRTRKKKHIIWSQHEGERLVTKFHHRLKRENLLFMFLSFQYFPVYFLRNRQDNSIYPDGLCNNHKKIRNRQGIKNFPDGYLITLTVICTYRLIRNFHDGYLISLCVFQKPSR